MQSKRGRGEYPVKWDNWQRRTGMRKQKGRCQDPRWIRMKNSLITKLQGQLERRLLELEHLRQNLDGKLVLRVAIELE